MALAAGDLVAPATLSGQGQQPTRGAVDASTPPSTDVLWDSGLLVTSVTATSLDKIVPTADPASLALIGSVVRRVLDSGSGTTASATYDATVISVYKRDNAGGGSPSADLALLKLLSNGQYQEILVSELESVSGL